MIFVYSISFNQTPKLSNIHIVCGFGACEKDPLTVITPSVQSLTGCDSVEPSGKITDNLGLVPKVLVWSPTDAWLSIVIWFN